MPWKNAYLEVEGGGGGSTNQMTTKKISLDINILNKKLKIHLKSGYATLNVYKTGQLKVTYGEDGFFTVPLGQWSPSDKLIKKNKFKQGGKRF